MTRYVYRRKPTKEDLGTAVGAGAGVGLAIGAVVAYLTQLFLRRETMGSETPTGARADEPARADRP